MSMEVKERPINKPGRKPLTQEPKNKRTAQNRAAQRAFRERKEKKMQELEDRVQLLEDEKTQIANESELLRMQVNSLMNKLSKYENLGSTGSTESSPTYFKQESISSASSVDSWAKNSTPVKEDFNEEVFCKTLNEACGSKECPLPQSMSAPSSVSNTSEGVSSPLIFINEMNNNKTKALDQIDSNIRINDQDDNNEMGFLFDQGNTMMFENIQDTDLLNDFNVLDVDFDKEDIFDDLLKQDNAILPMIPPSKDETEADEEADDLVNEVVPDDTENLMKCSQIWERITSHPKFSDIDIDGLCEELKQKAKCSERGAVLNGSDVGKVLKTAFKNQEKNNFIKTEEPNISFW